MTVVSIRIYKGKQARLNGFVIEFDDIFNKINEKKNYYLFTTCISPLVPTMPKS